MKTFFKVLKIISIIICIFIFFIALFGLIVSIDSTNAEGMARLGALFILPSCVAIIISFFDFLISTDLLKIGITYSFISTLIKIISILFIIRPIPYEFRQASIGNLSNLNFFIVLLILLLITTIPSTTNIIKLILRKKRIINC